MNVHSVSPSFIATTPDNSTPTTPAQKSFSAVMKAKSNDDPSAPIQHLGEFVDRVGADQRRLDRTMQAAVRGRDLDATELLRVQHLMYEHNQRVELASKVVQSAASGLKQILNMQV